MTLAVHVLIKPQRPTTSGHFQNPFDRIINVCLKNPKKSFLRPLRVSDHKNLPHNYKPEHYGCTVLVIKVSSLTSCCILVTISELWTSEAHLSYIWTHFVPFFKSLGSVGIFNDAMLSFEGCTQCHRRSPPPPETTNNVNRNNSCSCAEERHMEICKYGTVKSKGQFLQWGAASSAMHPPSLLFNISRNFEASLISDKEFSTCRTADVIC